MKLIGAGLRVRPFFCLRYGCDALGLAFGLAPFFSLRLRRTSYL
jgi:tetrahydromethanopterin S-methyltransferase subunit E